ncbi:MAG TPA: right-handed parallel beta-helix repeat-containing protein [Solirubrobacteraceae bacterium]|nr:right-handed parallel beta-helix repeat-containing protein [Solirubrobacteraceae bacterium]
MTAIGAIAVLAVLVGSTASNAFANTVFVSNTAPLSTSGRSCEAPRYATIQEAVDAVEPGTSIKVCPGTYAEQLVIEKSVKVIGADPATPPTVTAPEVVAHPTGPCATGAEADIEVMVCAASPVRLSNLHIDARFSEPTCAGEMKPYGVLVGGGATLTATHDEVLAPNRCSSGVGVAVGTTDAVEQTGHATLRAVSVSGYSGRGIAATGAGSSVRVIASDVHGGTEGSSAPTGIEISRGATGAVKGSTIARNSLVGRTLGTGILVDRAAPPVVIANDTLEEDGIGVHLASGATTAPSTPELILRRSRILNSDSTALLLEQGTASIAHNLIEGGEYGIKILQFGSQPFAVDATAAYDTISGMQGAAIYVVSDHAASDPPGDFLIKNSAISNNAAEVINESSTFTVTRSNDT